MADRKKWGMWIFWILLAVGVYVGSLRTLGDADIWFQLLAGKYALAHGAVPHTDFFLYAGHDAPQQFGGWGFGLVYELVIQAFGLTGTTFFNSLIWTGIFFFAIRAAMLRVDKGWQDLAPTQVLVLALMVAALFIASSTRMSMRAESTLMLSWSFSLWLFERCRSKGSYLPFWIGLPLVGLAEAWLHTGGFVLLVALPICFARLGMATWRKPETWVGWAACAVGLALLPMLNPNGPMQVYTQLMQILAMFSSEGKAAGPANLEYLPMWDARSVAILPKFVVLSLLGLLLWARKPSIGMVVENLACLAFLALAALHNRGISLAAMLIMVPALQLAMLDRLNRSLVSDRLAMGLAYLLCLAPVGVSSTVPNFSIQPNKMGYDFEVELIKRTHPDGAHILTVENGPALAYAFGDERYLVSKGGHTLIPNERADKHQQIVLNSDDGWEAELRDKKVDFACLPFYLTLPGRGIFYWLPSMLASSPEWKMHVGKGACNLFERLPKDHQLTEKESEDQTLIYLTNMSLYAGATHYGQPDVLGREIGAMAKDKIKRITEKNEKADKEKKLDEAPSKQESSSPDPSSSAHVAAPSVNVSEKASGR